jgi:hypothetical protein
VAQGNDVAAFDRRAGSYERGPLGEWHRLVAELISCPLRTTRRRTGSTLDALLHLALTGNSLGTL